MRAASIRGKVHAAHELKVVSVSTLLSQHPREQRVVERAKAAAELGYPDAQHDKADDFEQVLDRIEKTKKKRVSLEGDAPNRA
jgi:hypothetical protein